MSSKPKIIVLHMKEIVYTIIFALFILLLIFLLIFMFSNKNKNDEDVSMSKYIPGIYTSSITVNGTPMNLQVTVDKDYITSIDLIHTDDSVSTMYPLLQTSVDDISKQVVVSQSLENISCPDDSKYTYNALISKIEGVLDTAKATN